MIRRIQPKVDHRTSFLVALALGVCVAGCGQSPESVCKKLGALQDKSGVSADGKSDLAECAKKVGEIKDKDPAKFQCAAACADSTDYEKAKVCMVDCARVNNSAAAK